MSTRYGAGDLDSAVRALEGARLAELRRTLNIVVLGSMRGEEDVRLHVVCPFRVRAGDRILVASADMRYPLDRKDEDSFDKYRTRYDRSARMLTSRFAEHEFRIVRAELGRGGAITLESDLDLTIEVFPDVAGPIECWRLFTTSSDEHYVYNPRPTEDED
ncbi:hypothetical protein ACQP2F_44740 [Actinoplanes sp. CA-030573]|uniref:hypothetical protein n=1 Tax=Actinoplanes sp. CA-030573 TaxID=3239898 RepID=UPI003D8B5177